MDEAPGKLTADQKVALEDFLTSIASLPTNTRLSKSETDSVATVGRGLGGGPGKAITMTKCIRP